MTYDPNNIFARILRGEIPCSKVYEDEAVLAFNDISPVAPVHVLVIPKGAYVSFADFTAKAGVEAVGNFFITVGKIAELIGLEQGSYRLISNIGEFAGQTVHHFHIHIIGGKQLGALLAD